MACIWDKVLKNGPIKIFLKSVLHKLYLVHFWILCPVSFSTASNTSEYGFSPTCIFPKILAGLRKPLFWYILSWEEPTGLESLQSILKKRRRCLKKHYVSCIYFRGIVLEYTRDGPKIHENWLGVVTNFPTYDWHMSNLQNYANLQRKDIRSFRMAGKLYQKLV